MTFTAIRNSTRLRACLIAVLCVASLAGAGLNEIGPRPQQMGMLAVSPLMLDGSLVLVIPDNTTPEEAFVRDEAVAQLTAKLGIPPQVVNYSEWTGGQVSLWMGTPARFPALVDSLLAAQLPGLGLLLHEEEYHLLVNEQNIFIAGSDRLGLQWGLLTLIDLIGAVNGTNTIDRAYVRDWPDFGKRICTVNSNVRTQDQFDYADSLFDFAFHCKMDEIEWNDHDAGNPVRSPFALSHAFELRERVARRGQFLTMGMDRTGLAVTQKSWQEGVPIIGMPMTVTSTGFMPGNYGIASANSGFETWSGNRASSWTMYPESSYSLISRDNATRHSGSSSIKWANMSADYELDRTVHQRLHFGAHRFIKAKFWYKTSGYSGKLRFLILGDEPTNNHFENLRLNVEATANWTQLEVTFSTYHQDTASIWIGPAENSSGTMWIDDLTFENAGLSNILRRDDTPVAVYKQPGNILMTEGVDYTLADLNTPAEEDFVTTPRFFRLGGGGLANGDQVKVDYYSAIIFQTGRQTVCWSMLEPLEYYQNQVRVLDSTLAPDGFKIHINEVTMAGYDQNCASRGLSPGQLVGAYCDQMYDIIQARRPGANVRIYGDPFDVWVEDNRCHPITVSPWTIGSLQQLAPPVEMMVMPDYSNNVDSSFAYFNSHGHPALLSYYASNSFRQAVNGAVSARRAPNCEGVTIYDWSLEDMAKLPDFAALGWNLGPFFVHNPPRYSSRPDTIRLSAEMWADSFRLTDPVSLSSRSLTYRFLPGGTWTTVTPAAVGPRAYGNTLLPPQNSTSIEYYFTATDHRSQTRRLPPDAPTRVFSAQVPPSSPNNDVDLRKYNRGIIPSVDGQVIEWVEVPGAVGYEVHWSKGQDVSRRSQTLIAAVPEGQTKFFVDSESGIPLIPDELSVLPLFEKLPAKTRSANR